MVTIHRVLADAKRRIAPVSSSISLDAQLLLAAVLGVSRAHVIAHPERELTPHQANAYESLIARRERGEPVAYLLGRRAFYDRDFIVTPDVLIPRPETEHLLEKALAFARSQPELTAVDVGTGSGALAVTFAAHIPTATVYATDISAAALAVARRNAGGVNVHFLQGDLLLPLREAGVRVSLVMANLPYIAADELRTLAVSQHEPRLALDGGPDGLDVIRRLLEQVPAVCLPGAVILLEIGAAQAAAVRQLAQTILPAARSVAVFQDYAGHDRVVQMTLD